MTSAIAPYTALPYELLSHLGSAFSLYPLLGEFDKENTRNVICLDSAILSYVVTT